MGASLKRHFPYVYMPSTQPRHDEFPLDWTEFRLPFSASYVQLDDMESSSSLAGNILVKHGHDEDSVTLAYRLCASVHREHNLECIHDGAEHIEQAKHVRPLRRAVFVASRMPLPVEPQG